MIVDMVGGNFAIVVEVELVIVAEDNLQRSVVGVFEGTADKYPVDVAAGRVSK